MPLMTRPHRPRKLKARKGRGDGFTVSTRIDAATGKRSHHSIDTVRVLPGPKADTVVLQATDGHQAACVVTAGEVDQVAHLPRRLLRNTKTTEPLEVTRTRDGWASSNGQEAKPVPDVRFPRIAEVLPPFSPRTKANDHVSLALDVTLLVKLTEALGTSKLTLLIPQPGPDEKHITKAVAVCPATKASGVTSGAGGGIGVVMPLTPEQSVSYYRRVRRDVLAAESVTQPRPAASPVTS